MTMFDPKELRAKSPAELAELLQSAQRELRQLKMAVGAGSNQKVRHVRVCRQQVARLFTALRQAPPPPTAPRPPSARNKTAV